MTGDTEADRAAYYEAHKDDAEEWGEAEPARPRRRLASMISVRLTPREAEKIRRAADARGMSVSAFLRAAALCQALDTAAAEPSHTNLPSVEAVGAMRRPATGTVPVEMSVLAAPPHAEVSKIGEAHATSTSSA